MTPNGLGHAINGWLGRTFGAASPVAGARQVTVRSSIGLPLSLYVATTSLSRTTTSALQKKLRQAGFKGAVVEPLLRGDGGGFTVQYQGREYKFWIEESPSTERYESNPMLKDSDKRVVRAFVNEKPATSKLLDMGRNGAPSRKFTAGDRVERDDGSMAGSIAIVGNYDETIGGYRYKVEQDDGGRIWWNETSMQLESHRQNGRGIYHGTPAGKNDMVIYQGRSSGDGSQPNWRIDLVTSTSGTHTDITGPNRGYSAPSAAFTAALDAQHTRGIRGKSHVYIADRDGNLSDYEPEGAHLPFERNGRDSGILSDGTRINAYHLPGGLEEWTFVPHGMDWDQMERRGMRTMLGTSATGSGFSQWTEGQEGRHLGKKVHWDQVPEELKRHVESRVVREDSMSANGRASTVDEHAARELSLYIENEYALIGAPNSIGKSIDTNLRKKVAGGKYDPTQAPKAWQYLIDEGAKRYTKEYGSQGDFIFNAATRRQVAEEFARAWELENRVSG